MSSSVRATVKRGAGVRPLAQVCILLLFATGTSMVVGGAPEARAQQASPCADTLGAAEEAYRNRNYERATSLASQCTDQEVVADSTAIRAYRVITLASLRQGTLTRARSAVRNILKIDPEYTADSVNDPPSYNLFVSMMRKRVDIAEAAEEEEETPTEEKTETPDEEETEATEPEPSRIQTVRTDDTVTGLFVKPPGIGISDYTGDMPAQTASHPFDFQEFNRGSGFPFMLHGELGYQFAPRWALVLGVQVGNYPIIGYNTGNQSISDSWRYTPQLLIRHAFGPLGETTVFYADVGANATFGGKGVAKTGYGPSIGGGLDIPIGGAVSFYLESRFNFTLPDDAIDGSVASEFAEDADDFDNVQDSVTGSFDSVNQLLGLGLRVRL